MKKTRKNLFYHFSNISRQKNWEYLCEVSIRDRDSIAKFKTLSQLFVLILDKTLEKNRTQGDGSIISNNVILNFKSNNNAIV